MSKNVTTRWYIGAWIVWAISLIVFFMTAHVQSSSTGFAAFAGSPISAAAWVVAGISGIVMLIMWIGALIRLGQLHRWGWFAAVLVLQLIGLGIIAMVAYAVAGPEDTMSVTRPSVT